VLAVAEAEHLDVVQADNAAVWWDVAGAAVEDSVMRSGERSLLDGDVVDDVEVVDLDVPVGECGEAAAVELGAGCFPSPRIPPGAAKMTSSASTSANASMSCALKVSVPFSKASRVVVVMRESPSVGVVHAEGRWVVRWRVGTLVFSPSRARGSWPRRSIPSLVYARER
jgi:hypothetical protein